MSSEGDYNVRVPSRGLGKPDRKRPVSDKIEREVSDVPLSFPSRVFPSSSRTFFHQRHCYLPSDLRVRAPYRVDMCDNERVRRTSINSPGGYFLRLRSLLRSSGLFGGT